MEQKQQSAGYFNGLLLGILIGAGLVLLVTTKKGKEILRLLTEEGIDSVHNLEDLYKKLEKALEQTGTDAPSSQAPKAVIATPVTTVPPVEKNEVEEKHEPADSPRVTAPEAIALSTTPTSAVEQNNELNELPVEDVAVKEKTQSVSTAEEVQLKPRIITVDHETSAKLAEMQARLDREIHAVSEAIANNYVPYAEDAEEEVEEPSERPIKATRRRFFRGIPRRA